AAEVVGAGAIRLADRLDRGLPVEPGRLRHALGARVRRGGGLDSEHIGATGPDERGPGRSDHAITLAGGALDAAAHGPVEALVPQLGGWLEKGGRLRAQAAAHGVEHTVEKRPAAFGVGDVALRHAS